MSTRFPKLLHITYETPRNDDPYLLVRETGVAGDSGIEETTPCAIYKLVSIGQATVQRQFVPNKRQPRA